MIAIVIIKLLIIASTTVAWNGMVMDKHKHPPRYWFGEHTNLIQLNCPHLSNTKRKCRDCGLKVKNQ